MATADHDAAGRDAPAAQPRRSWSLAEYQAVLTDWYAGRAVSEIAIRAGRSERAIEGALARLRASGVPIPRRQKTGDWVEGPPGQAPRLAGHPAPSASIGRLDPRTTWLLADYQALVDRRYRGERNDEIAAAMGRTTAAVAVRVAALRRGGVALPPAGHRGLDTPPRLNAADLSRIRQARSRIRQGQPSPPVAWAAAERVTSEQSRRPSSRTSRWSQWLDGQTHVLRRGEDFTTENAKAIEGRARAAASRRRTSLTVTILDKDTVTVRAYHGSGARPAPRKPNGWTEAELRLLVDLAHELPPAEIAAQMPSRSKRAVESALYRLRRAGISVPGPGQPTGQKSDRPSRQPVSVDDLRRAGFQL